MELETSTLTNDEIDSKTFCFDPIDLGEGSNPQRERDCDELVESVRIMISDAENDTLLFEIDDLELTEVKLRDGVFTLTAVQKLYADIIYFQKAVEEGRVTRRTLRATFS
jgi:hypothetical protein